MSSVYLRRYCSLLRVTLLSHVVDIRPFKLFSFLPPTASEGANLTLSLLFFLKVLSFNLPRKKKKKRLWPEVTDHIRALFRFTDHLIKLKSSAVALFSSRLCSLCAKVKSINTHRDTHTASSFAQLHWVPVHQE